MLKLLVIADDFTGALDTSVQFANLGVKTLVTTDKTINYQLLEDDLEILVIDSESRYLSFTDSYNIISEIIKKAKKHQVPFIYKKVDSALRGNISSEIKAVLDHFPEKKVPFIPAFPKVNRIVRNGNLYIDGQLVSESVFGQDPYEPVTESNIQKRLQDEANIDSQLIRDDQINEVSHNLLLFDSATDEDLSEIMTVLKEKGLSEVIVGCAGFAKIFANAIFPNREPQKAVMKAPLIVICGSVNPITKQQIEYAEMKQYKRYSLSPHQLLEPDYWESAEGQEWIATYHQAILENDLIIFDTLSAKTINDLTHYGEVHGISTSAFRFRIGQSLGSLSKQLLERSIDQTLLFTGGDTLFQSMQALKINQIKPLYEMSPGVVLSEIVWRDKPVQVITKSGGFGNKELFVDLIMMN
ncbi:membrane protein [Lederbergia ruris]|uniref:Membrane protein n=1 Tax=Lederbergia ruris TaxID=217495 RepID=A0ABQ4KM22_9BACI|nr:four-carbon acid sugar kinase family protein [Lederbergia ruris]GIN58984.1 membrane protein [Lederbergia ruris]